MELPLAGVVGAAIGVGVGLFDFALVASLARRMLGRRLERMEPRRNEATMRLLFVANALVFGALGWWFGVTVAGTGLGPPA